MNRRDVITALLALSASGALVACGQKEKADSSAGDGAQFSSPGQFFTSKEMALISLLCGIIIPATETPGALEVGVPSQLQSLLSEWADDDMRRGWRAGLADIEARLNASAGGAFANAPSSAKTAAVAALDAAAFGEGRDSLGSYREIKSTLATAYYMSEVGATQELRYEAVPGEWKGCVPFSSIGRTWAT